MQIQLVIPVIFHLIVCMMISTVRFAIAIMISILVSYVAIKKDFIVIEINYIVSGGQLFSAGCYLSLSFFVSFGLHQNSSYAPD